MWSYYLFCSTLILIALASPPNSVSQTLGINQQRTSSVPWISISSVSSVQNSSVAAVTSPSYLGPDGKSYIFSGYDWVSGSVYCGCKVYDGSKYLSSRYPADGTRPTYLGLTVPSTDNRAYVVACGSSTCTFLAYSQKCEFQYSVQSKVAGLSPLVLWDNSVLAGLDNQLIIFGNASSPFPGQVLWRYNFTSSRTYYGAVTALSSNEPDGTLFVAFTDCPSGCGVIVNAMQPLASGPGYSLSWTNNLGSGYLSCGGSSACRSVPAVCDESLLILMKDKLVALDQRTGNKLWSYNQTFDSRYIVARTVACHTGGWIFVVSDETIVHCLKSNGSEVIVKWTYDTTPYKIARNPVVDKSGNVYILAGGSEPYDPNKAYLFSWDLSGKLLFARQINSNNNDSTSPRYSSQLVLWENGITVVIGSMFSVLGS